MSEEWQEALDIDEVEVNDAFLAHMADRHHFVRAIEVQEVLDGNPVFFTNEDQRGEHRAPVIMVGRTRRGRLLAIPIAPTERPGVWRAVTAFTPGPALLNDYADAMEDDDDAGD
jgi:hypothetical protein